MIHRFSTPLQSKSNRTHKILQKTHSKIKCFSRKTLDSILKKFQSKLACFSEISAVKKTGFSWMTQRLIKIFRIVRWLNLPIGVSFVDWTRQYFNCVWVELELFLSGFSDVTTSMAFSYQVVSETVNIFVSRQFLADFEKFFLSNTVLHQIMFTPINSHFFIYISDVLLKVTKSNAFIVNLVTFCCFLNRKQRRGNSICFSGNFFFYIASKSNQVHYECKNGLGNF